MRRSCASMRLPCRYMFLFDLSVAVLAGVGAHWLSHLTRPAERARARRLCGTIAVALAIAALWIASLWLNREHLLAGVMARSRTVAKSGISPRYQNTKDTVKYVEIANTSQSSGELKFTHREPNWLGSGSIQ